MYKSKYILLNNEKCYDFEWVDVKIYLMPEYLQKRLRYTIFVCINQRIIWLF